jgi:hypothetical protein
MRLFEDEAVCAGGGGDDDDDEEEDGGGGGDDDDEEEETAGTSASTGTAKKPFQRGPARLPEHLPRPEDRPQIVISGT